MIEKAIEADDGYELGEFLARDESNATVESATDFEVHLRFDRATTYTTFSRSGLPDGWGIEKVRFGRSGDPIEVVLAAEGA